MNDFFENTFTMKIVKISLFVSFLFLWSISLFSQKRIVEHTTSIEILQDPLSDDTTNPVNNHIIIAAEIDLEDSNENHSISNHFTIIPFLNTNLVYNSLIDSNQSGFFKQTLPLSSYKTSQSYLNVFRI